MLLPFLVVALTVAQTPPDWSSEVLKTVGPFTAAVLIGGMWVRELLARAKEARVREQVLSDRLVELAERTLPAITENTKVLGEVLEELRRLQAKRER